MREDRDRGDLRDVSQTHYRISNDEFAATRPPQTRDRSTAAVNLGGFSALIIDPAACLRDAAIRRVLLRRRSAH
jgi:hypothetical protein